MKYRIGQRVKAAVMFDVYDFKIIGKDGIKKKYQLQWLSGGGSFWVNEDEIKK